MVLETFKSHLYIYPKKLSRKNVTVQADDNDDEYETKTTEVKQIYF